jgi:hypothetical protein
MASQENITVRRLICDVILRKRSRTPSGRLPTKETERLITAAALAPQLKGLNITTDLLQVGKVVTGQQW